MGDSNETQSPGLMLIAQFDVVGAVQSGPPEPNMRSGGSACGEHEATVKKAGRRGITQMKEIVICPHARNHAARGVFHDAHLHEYIR